jgi:Mg2+ and Co2+ transporter CorA
VAARLAAVAAVTPPITALSSVRGMNVIVNSPSDPVLLTVLLVIMGAPSVLPMRARRHGRW